MYFQFEVSVEIERSEGKFISREEASKQIMKALDSGNPDQIDGDDGGVYEVVNFEVQEIEQVKPASTKKIIEEMMPAITVLTGSTDKKKAEQFLMLLKASGRSIV